jgi:hypothetical protein|tara:strand:+ start:6347 stop:6739 length:393 start_codon:yes stop_codon:yes gene_type:complete
MREDILNYIKTLSLGSFTVSDELPREEAGLMMYIKNPKRIYVEREQYSEEPLIQTLDGLDIHSEATTVSIYFTADAKTIPANYETLIQSLRLGKNVNTTSGYNNRAVEVQSEYVNDLLVTQIDYTFSKLT